MVSVIITGMDSGYARLIYQINAFGFDSSPRGESTSEMLGMQFRLLDPTNNLPLATGRKLNRKIAFAEGLQLVSGRSYPELMVRIAPNFNEFTNGGTWFHGAYGPRLRNQLPRVLDALQSDADSRQAIATIWDPNYDGHGGTADTPCTIGLQFFNRRDKLQLITTMRSNDVWWGVPYDVFQFTFLQIQLAQVLGLEPGVYTHQAGSFHLYDRDRVEASRVTANHLVRAPIDQTICMVPSWPVIQDVAESILNNVGHPLETAFGASVRTALHE